MSQIPEIVQWARNMHEILELLLVADHCKKDIVVVLFMTTLSATDALDVMFLDVLIPFFETAFCIGHTI